MNKVKIQAMSEVQKAVAEAEQKAFEVIATERARMEQTIADVKRQAAEDAFLVINEQEESTEVRVRLALGAGLGRPGVSAPSTPSRYMGHQGLPLAPTFLSRGTWYNTLRRAEQGRGRKGVWC